MAGQQQDNGPYSLYGRRTENEAEVRVGSHDNLDRAKAEADDMVDSGVWHTANVRDRNDQTVHASRKESRENRGNGPDEPLPAA